MPLLLPPVFRPSAPRPPAYRSLRRALLLAITLLSACAAADPVQEAATDPVAVAPTAHRNDNTAGAVLIARFAADEGDVDAAALAYQRALAMDPANAALRQEAFLTNLLAARPEAMRLAPDLPDNLPAQLLLADRDARAGDWKSAEARFAGLGHQGIADLMRPLLVAWAEVGRGQLTEALAALRPLADGKRLQPIYSLHAALIADLGGQTAEATRLYHAAEAGFGPGNLEVARAIASWQARQGDRTAATATLRAMASSSDDMMLALPRLVAALPDRPIATPLDGIAETYLAFASLARAQEADELAFALVRLALDARPDLVAARLLGADVIAAGKRPAGALDILTTISPTDPLAPVVRLRRATLLDQLDRPDEALRVLRQLATDDPTRPEPLSFEGDILRAKHRYGEAVAAYDKAVALIGTPTQANWPLFYDRGIALDQDKQWARAEADFEKALQISPDQPFVLNYLGYSWTEQGRNLDRAHTMIERAVQQRPNDGAIVDSLGWVVLRQGDNAQAVTLLERATELEPDDPTINGHLGDAYWAAGRKLEAEFQWRRALTLKPDPADVPKLEAKLRDADKALGIPTAAATKPAP
jgi:Flp pilus assembly protein TadD